MFTTVYNAATVTASGTYFLCEEKKEISIVNVQEQYLYFHEEIELPYYKIRRFNRIQTSDSKKTKRSIGINFAGRQFRNIRENENRSKERFHLKAA